MTVLAIAVAAAVASWILAQLWPAADPLRTSVVILPLIVASLVGFEGWGRRLGARQLGSAGSLAELAVAAALVVLASVRLYLAPGLSAALFAGAFWLVLMERLLRQVLALRPLLGQRLPRRPSVLFFLLPLVAYLAILPWSAGQRQPDGDEPFYLLMTHSLVEDLDVDLTDEYRDGSWQAFMDRPLEPQPGDPTGSGGEVYSRHNYLLSLVLVPGYAVAGKVGALVTMALLAACLGWLTLRLAYRYFPDHPGEALLAWGLLALAPPLLFYSHQVWVEVPAALLAMLALDQILDLGQHLKAAEGRGEATEAAAAQWGRRKWLGIGLPLLLLPLLKIRLMLLSLPLLALAWGYARRPRKPLLSLMVLLFLVGVAILGFNTWRYGNPLKIHSAGELALYRYDLADFFEGGFGLFFDSAFGLFPTAPLWLLIAPGLALLVLRRPALGRHPLPRDLAVYCLPYLLIVAPRSEWYGGWSPPFRYALIILPLLALALIPVLADRHRGSARICLGALGGLTLALGVVMVAVPGWTYNLADGTSHLLDQWSRSLGADVGRFFPSYVRPRAASWWWPPLALLAVALPWLLPRLPLSRPRTAQVRNAQPRNAQPRNAQSLGTLGLALTLVAAALVPWAARALPTRVAEAEDAQVRKVRGHLHPEVWTTDRTSRRGGWTLRRRESMTIPVVAGGSEVALALEVRFVRNGPGPTALEVWAGDEELLTTWRPRRDGWQRAQLGTFPWVEGAPLVLVVAAPAPAGAKELDGFIVDRVELEWSEP